LKVSECPACQSPLDDVRKSQIEAILGSGKIPEWVEMITGVPKADVSEGMTFNQMKHFAAIFWKQNFDDEGLPKESKENFKKLLGMIGLGEKAPAAKIPETTEKKE
jgi:hypothetical protein